jgi:hypothetical protein
MNRWVNRNCVKGGGILLGFFLSFANCSFWFSCLPNSILQLNIVGGFLEYVPMLLSVSPIAQVMPEYESETHGH